LPSSSRCSKRPSAGKPATDGEAPEWNENAEEEEEEEVRDMGEAADQGARKMARGGRGGRARTKDHKRKRPSAGKPAKPKNNKKGRKPRAAQGWLQSEVVADVHKETDLEDATQKVAKLSDELERLRHQMGLQQRLPNRARPDSVGLHGRATSNATAAAIMRFTAQQVRADAIEDLAAVLYGTPVSSGPSDSLVTGPVAEAD
jgi:hypothetical protein